MFKSMFVCFESTKKNHLFSLKSFKLSRNAFAPNTGKYGKKAHKIVWINIKYEFE